MAVKRKKIDRKVDLVLDKDRVVDMPPGWTFTVEWPHSGTLTLNFDPYRSHDRERLAGHFRDACWNLRREVAAKTLDGYERIGLRVFWRFLDDLQGSGISITDLSQIDRKLLDRYLAWLELQTVSKGRNIGKLWTTSAKRKPFEMLKALLVNRQKRTLAAISKELTFPRNPFPNAYRASTKRQAYSQSEQKRILSALNHDLRCIHEDGSDPLSSSQVLFVHLLLLAVATGRNMQSLLELRRDSLRQHPAPDRELLVTTKRRGWSSQATGVAKTTSPIVGKQDILPVPASIGDHIRFLCDYTAPLIEEAEPKYRDLVFLWHISKYERKGMASPFNAGHASAAACSFAERHRLTDDQGQPMVPSLARMRPTFATELYRRTRDIRRVQQALGHASVETTARHYAEAPLEAERDHAIVLDGMVARFTRLEFQGHIIVAADGQIPLTGVENLLKGGYNTGIARCQNPFRADDSVCKKLLYCFRCPNMCVFEDDLWRLFSFYYRLLSERSKINPAHWMKTYGPIIRRIDNDIAPLFPPEKIEQARREAQQNPHPTWRGPIL